MAIFCLVVLIIRFTRADLKIFFFQLEFYELVGATVYYVVVNININNIS
ncbi:MAG: hypothetical protein MJ252_21285 [archaeon]|nr:hypothetical protein [archaeon]